MMRSCKCGKPLEGRQRVWCSRRCKWRDSNAKHKSYAVQQEKGQRLKALLIEMRGGSCEWCGYHRNMACMSFHHKDPATKRFELSQQSLANRSWGSCLEEFEKCVLLCLNCHGEAHHPLEAALRIEHQLTCL